MSSELRLSELRQGLGEFCMLMYLELCKSMNKEDAVNTILQELDNEKAWFLSSVGIPVTPNYINNTIADLRKEAQNIYNELKNDSINEEKRFTYTTKYDRILVAIEVLQELGKM